MKTSNKILIGGLIVFLLGIVAVMVGIKINYKKIVEHRQQNLKMENRQVQPFHSIQVTGNLNVRWKQDSVQRVSVEAFKEQMNLVKTNVRNGCLYVSAKAVSAAAPVINLHIASPGIQQLTLNDSCKFETVSDLQLKDFKLDMSGHVNAKLEGTVNSAVMICSAESRLVAGDLTLQECYIEAMTGSVAHLEVNRKLDVLVKSDARVYYSGRPESVDIKTSGDGSAEPY